PHIVRENQAPTARFPLFSPKHPPLACRLILRTQKPNCGLPYPNKLPTTQIQALPHVVRESRAPTAWFALFSPKHPPLTRRLIAQTQNPNCGLTHPNNPLTTQIRTLLHIVRKNQAPTA